MLEAVATAAGASYAAVYDEVGSTVASVGASGGTTLDVPLRHNGVALGRVSVGSRRGEPRVSDRDARLIVALAPHLPSW